MVYISLYTLVYRRIYILYPTGQSMSKDSSDSRVGETESVSWWVEWQRICGLIYSTTHGLFPSSKTQAPWLAKALFWPSRCAALKSFLTQCSRLPPQINQKCHKKWNLSAIWTLPWIVNGARMENPEFLALSLGPFLSSSLFVLTSVSSLPFLRFCEKSHLFLPLKSKNIHPWD